MSSENVEAMVIAWLNDVIADYHASSDTPKVLPNHFILVERTGGQRVAMLGDNAEILIEVYHNTSRADCSEIANWIADHIHELTATISLDDREKQYHRYQIYCDVFHSRVSEYNSEPPAPTPIPSA